MLAEPLLHLDPVTAAMALCSEDGFLWLDSAGPSHPESRFSYICLWPVDRLSLPPEPASVPRLREWFSGIQGSRIPDGAPFQGGAAGYVAYDFAPAFMDRFASRHEAPRAPALEFGLYDMIVAFDHLSGLATAYSAGIAAHGAVPDDRLARDRITRLKAVLSADRQACDTAEPVRWRASFSDESYVAAVEQAQELIRNGDIYQANIAGLWRAEPVSRDAAFAHYLATRQRAQGPFSAFGVFRGRMISSFSPERLVRACAGGRVKAEPIKGTIRKGVTDAEDTAQKAKLLSSEKDRAENVMIVDLLRNDLSRVCNSSSVQVPSFCRLETFANLHHLVSTIEGDLAPSKSGVDLLAAVFPGGSITGAPKLRAMEIIDLLEPEARGIFCGSIGWIGLDGALDFSILIRSIDLLPDVSRFWAGAGITLLSEPKAELDEIRLKAERLIVPVETPAEAL